MSGPDEPRWLDAVSDELRRDVPVRYEWRARLLADVAELPRPSVDDVPGDDVVEARRDREPRVVLGPMAALAAAIILMLAGAGLALGVVSLRTRTGAESSSRSLASVAGSAGRGQTSGAGSAVVHFQLAAPQASRVSLVGSFNEWDPVATPLVRDGATGRWTVALRLPPGRHVYAFVVDGDVTADPDAPLAADDDFGSANSVVLVAAPRT